MRAIAITEFGGVEKLQLLAIPMPEPGKCEILIRIKAAGVNPVDWKIRAGMLQDRLPHEFPLIPGWDAAGIVSKKGPQTDLFTQGDEVYAYCRKPVIKEGTYAEYVVVPQSSAALKPKNMSFEEAATVPLSALTAYQCLLDAAKLERNETVLIHAAAGGVGSFAVQLAKQQGARVLGTARIQNHEYLRSIGCDVPIDYNAGDFRRFVQKACPTGVDVVFDCIGGGVLATSVEVLRANGRVVSIIAPDEVETLKRKGVNAHYVFVSPNHEELTALTHMIEARQLRSHVSARFHLTEAAQAQELSKSGHTRGKIVLVV